MLSPNFENIIITAAQTLNSDTLNQAIGAIESKLGTLGEDAKLRVIDAAIKAEIICDMRAATLLTESQSEEAIQITDEMSVTLSGVYNQFARPMDRKLLLLADELEKQLDGQEPSAYIASLVDRITSSGKISLQMLLITLISTTLMEDEAMREQGQDSSITETTKERLLQLLEKVGQSTVEEDTANLALAVAHRLDTIDEELGRGIESLAFEAAIVGLVGSLAQNIKDCEFISLPEGALPLIKHLLKEIPLFSPTDCNLLMPLVEHNKNLLRFRVTLHKTPGQDIRVRITAADPRDPDTTRYDLSEFPCKLVDLAGQDHMPVLRPDGSVRYGNLQEDQTYQFYLINEKP
jgi:hypothetical protein